MALTMQPDKSLLTPVQLGRGLRADARPQGALRDELRHIPSIRNAVSVVALWGQTVALVVLACWLHHPMAWLALFVLFGRAHAQFAALMHEAAHRLLLRNRAANDWAGRWLLGFPSFSSPDAYRRGHMAHHREEFGPDEPDIALYRDYPITTSSLRRKLWRDASGRTGWKLMRAQFGALVSGPASSRRAVGSIYLTQAALLTVCLLAGRWYVYVLWVGAYLTVWRVINRLRSIAEHGGLAASPDRRETTHSVRQSVLADFWLVPYNIGWHLAHHTDSGIPWRNLPRYHRLLVDAGYVPPGLEHPSYRALWKTLSSRPEPSVTRRRSRPPSAPERSGDH